MEALLRKWLEDVVLLRQSERGQARRQDRRGAAHRDRRLHGRECGHSALCALRDRRGLNPGDPTPQQGAAFKRVLLKLSGEALMGDLAFGADPARIAAIAAQVKIVSDRGVEIAIVVGGGNIYRGLEAAAGGWTAPPATTWGCSRPSSTPWPCRMRSSGPARARGCSPPSRSPRSPSPTSAGGAMRHLEKGRIVIFAAGTGNPFFTTDTAAALRALEIHAEAILMGKNGVEGVYSADPRLDPDAKFIAELSHHQAIEQRLAVMDSTALSLCMDNALPIHVFNMDDEGNIDRIVCGERRGNCCEERMSDEVLSDFEEAAARMQKSVEATRAEFSTVRRLSVAAPAGPHRRRLLRGDHPAAAARAGLGHRGPPADDHPLRQELDQDDREIDPRVRRRTHALQRRPGDPPADPRAHRGAPVRELVKVVHGIAEQGRVAVRNIRRDIMHDLRELKKEGEVGSATTSVVPRASCRS